MNLSISDVGAIRLEPGESYQCIFKLHPQIKPEDDEHQEATAGSESLKIRELEQFSELSLSWHSVSPKIQDLPNPEKRASI